MRDMLLLWNCLPLSENCIYFLQSEISCARLCDTLDFRCQLVVDQKKQQLCEWPPAWTTQSGREFFDAHEANLCVSANTLFVIASEQAQYLIAENETISRSVECFRCE